ncbi:hypothetical protein VTO42DRAFT_5023 [Malbranchea cinnamomea]
MGRWQQWGPLGKARSLTRNRKRIIYTLANGASPPFPIAKCHEARPLAHIPTTMHREGMFHSSSKGSSVGFPVLDIACPRTSHSASLDNLGNQDIHTQSS